MTRKEAEKLKDTINSAYQERNDYPSYALTSWADRNRFTEYVFKIIDEQVNGKKKAR